MNDAQIKHMVEQFLRWKLPEDFNPDGGISFQRDYNQNTPHPAKHEPVGTNLFDYNQATEMVHHMLADLPSEAKPVEALVRVVKANWNGHVWRSVNFAQADEINAALATLDNDKEQRK